MANAADEVHARLRDSILSRELRPNQRLVEVDLAESLGVSRTPVREALLRLRQDGLVVQNKGWLVRDHDPAEVLEYLEARAILESATASLAATRVDADTIARLRSLQKEMEGKSHSRREINALNSEFHSIITEAGGNGVLASYARNTDVNYWTFRTPVVFNEVDNTLVEQEHRQLIDALERGDADEAARIARAHVERTSAIIARSLGLDEER